MTDQYKDQYKKETEQIHAPADLIARTKAAVREEEARIQREFAAQGAELAGQSAKPAAQQTFAVQKKHGWGAAARKWAYPLTAVAAIFVLVSVSMMMRGLGKSGSNSAPLVESGEAADCGGEESAAAGAVEEGIEEEAFESAEIAEEPEMEAASVTETEDMAPEMETASVTEAEDMAPEMEMASEKKIEDAAAGIANVDSAAEVTAGSVEKHADETKRASASEEMASQDNMSVTKVTVKRVRTRPAFADSADAELHTYEDKVFWVVKEDQGWAAYVESESRGGYEIRGEAEDLETFLAAGYKRLEEISY